MLSHTIFHLSKMHENSTSKGFYQLIIVKNFGELAAGEK